MLLADSDSFTQISFRVAWPVLVPDGGRSRTRTVDLLLVRQAL